MAMAVVNYVFIYYSSIKCRSEQSQNMPSCTKVIFLGSGFERTFSVYFRLVCLACMVPISGLLAVWTEVKCQARESLYSQALCLDGMQPKNAIYFLSLGLY